MYEVYTKSHDQHEHVLTLCGILRSSGCRVEQNTHAAKLRVSDVWARWQTSLGYTVNSKPKGPKDPSIYPVYARAGRCPLNRRRPNQNTGPLQPEQSLVRTTLAPNSQPTLSQPQICVVPTLNLPYNPYTQGCLEVGAPRHGHCPELPPPRGNHSRRRGV